MNLAQTIALLNLAASALSLVVWTYTGSSFSLWLSGLNLGCAIMGWATSVKKESYYDQ